jgi:hypothetical protein
MSDALGIVYRAVAGLLGAVSNPLRSSGFKTVRLSVTGDSVGRAAAAQVASSQP